jgi:hypothetical protein
VRVAYDPQALYLLFVCEEPKPDRLVADARKRDRLVWMDDCVEAWIAPTGLRAERAPVYYRLVVNSAGTQFDERRRQSEWDGTWQAAATVSRDRWVCEMRVPFATLNLRKPPQRGQRWLVNFIRRRQVVPAEESSFSLCHPRDAAKFGELVFE